ncbi:MAG: DUF4294 domain-containing protein [Prevotellaceae bacterium]|nr:DUF4294 domain-containing protein [Prevotellaceae bacterium]
MKYTINIIMLLLATCWVANAQETRLTNTQWVVYEGDTVSFIPLHDAYCFPEMQFKNKKQEEFYWKTVRDVKRTLPYAKMASRLMVETDKELQAIETEKERNKFLKQKEKELFNQFEGDLRKMTISQGKMLVRLVDRECSRTTYDIIKMYRGNFSAVFWNGIAHIFGSNLKWEYDGTDKDKIVERVILLVEAGQL